jgi:hypothetical protein
MRIGDGLRIGVAGACATVALGLPSIAAAGGTVAEGFTVAGEHQFVVPPAVTAVDVTLVGGYGGSGSAGTPGGIPATVKATIAVSPGETLYAEVAGNGESAEDVQDRGGYDGGGQGGIRSFLFASGPGGGGGGGASDVRTCATAAQCSGQSSLLSRLLVAGGGGGGGGNGLDPPSTAGGVGGSADQSGDAGAHDSATDYGGTGGLRGNPSSGGAPGTNSGACEPVSGDGCPTSGELGNGGEGGESVSGGGGGGGGGIFGGGGGGAGDFTNVGTPSSPVFANGGGGGGGGGSSGTPAGAIGVSDFSLVATAEGTTPSVTFSWTAPAPTVLTGQASQIGQTTATLNGTVNPNAWQPTGCSFAISPAPSGVSTFPCAQQLATGISPVPVSATAAGLAPGTQYTATLTSSTMQGSSQGAPVTFTTSAIAVSTGPPPTYGSTGPKVTDLELSPSTFRRGKHMATIAKSGTKKKAPTATTVSFDLSEAATVTLGFEPSRPGVTVGKRCVVKSRRNSKGKRCSLWMPAHGNVIRAGHAGLDKIHFEGILDADKPLPAGTYRLSLKASDQAGSATAPQHPTFKLTA